MRVSKEYIVNPCDKSNMITEAFGIDAGYIRKICNIDIPDDWDILYITGESGSGKSTIAREMFPNYKSEDIPDTKLFLWGGEEEDKQIDTLSLLTLVGISDATMFISSYDELSDSQQARARIALEIMSDKDVIVVDEFLSTLDRKTAKAVAYCIQKAIRKYGKKGVFITAHEDLSEYIMPDYIIKGKSFPSDFVVEKCHFDIYKNIILENTTFRYGDKYEYRNLSLGELHYKGKYTGGTKEFLYAEYDGEVIGVLVSTYRMHDGGRRISRVVIHPSYRGIGIGASIVKKYISDYPNSDVVAAMGRINPVFEKAGMKRVDDSVIKPPAGLLKSMKKLGFDNKKWFSKNYCCEFCKDKSAREELSRFAGNATHLVCPGGKYLSNEEIAQKILEDSATAGRVLYGLREHRMAKYVS